VKYPYYTVSVTYPGYDHSYDDRIAKVVRRSADGHGYCFDGTRDVTFWFQTKEGAKNAAKRVREMRPKRRGTRVTVIEVT
jgi:hypothetical protein